MRNVKALISRLESAETPGQAVSTFKLAELQLLIDKADQRYYREGQSQLITDEQYDALRPALKELEPEDTRVARVGVPYSVDELRTKVPHAIPMGSLDNTDDGIVGYDSWYHKTCATLGVENTKIIASLKIDGGSLRLRYEKGRLVEAVTRGNGEVGENITANAVNFMGVPTVLPKEIDLDVRGEAVLYVTAYQTIRSRDMGGRPFDQIPAKDQSNPRNIGNGIFGRDDGQDSEQMTFIAFNVHNGQDLVTEEGKFFYLRDLGFTPVPHRVCESIEEIERFYSDTADGRNKLPFEIDGVVVCLNDLDQQKNFITEDPKSRLRPKFARAIKFPHKSNTTILKSVDLTVGHTGAIIPTAILEEVRIGGVNVTHALLNNWDEIERLKVAINDKVEVILAGDIIPKIIRVVSPCPNRVSIDEPTECPACSGATTRTRRGKSGAVTYCTNSDCPEARLQRINHWIGTAKKGTGILGIGDTILRTMWDEKAIEDAADLYTLKASDIEGLQLSGGGVIGNSRSTKIVEAIDGKRHLSLHIFLGSLGIELLGRRRAQILVKAAAGELDKLSDWLDDSKLETIQLEGFGDAIRSAIRTGIAENRPLIDKLIANGVTIDEPDSTPVEAGTDDRKFAGVTFCFTGTRAYTEETTELGGELTSSVAKTKPRPDFLVQKDPLSTSNKTKNAEANGHTRIISVEYLKRVIDGQASLDDISATDDATVADARASIADTHESNMAIEAGEMDTLAAELTE